MEQAQLELACQYEMPALLAVASSATPQQDLILLKDKPLSY